MEHESSTYYRILAETENAELACLYVDLDDVKQNYYTEIITVRHTIQGASNENPDSVELARGVAQDSLHDLLKGVEDISEKLLLRSPEATLARRLEELYCVLSDVDLWRRRSHAEAITDQPVIINPPKSSAEDFVNAQLEKINQGSSDEIDNLEDLQEDLVQSYGERARSDLELCLQVFETKKQMIQEL